MGLMSLTEQDRQILLKVAREAIEHELAAGDLLPINTQEYGPALQEIKASFVTLEILGNLRGCIGALVAARPLVNDVACHAHAAAFSDPRFPALRYEEFPNLTIHISILSSPEPVLFKSEADLISKLRPGVDGLILEDGWNKGTFLPSVWNTLPNPKEFLRHLKHKAGLDMDYWSERLRIQRYTTESFS